MRKRVIVMLSALLVCVMAATGAFADAFADVPTGHWSYDAVRYLASRGVLSGYPDGSFGGERPATRYEMASAVSRALENLDKRKADQRSVELLKRLSVEYYSELTRLDAKTDQLDIRTSTLEDRLGGWRLSGTMIFDANFANSNNGYTAGLQGRKNWNTFGDSHLYLTKMIDADNFVAIRFGLRPKSSDDLWNNELALDRMYWQGNLNKNIDLTVGRFEFDWERDAGLYQQGENDGWFGHMVADGFQLRARMGIINAGAVAARNLTSPAYPLKLETVDDSLDAGFYGLRLHADFDGKAMLGGSASILKDDNENLFGDVNTYSLYGGFRAAPGVNLKGVYYWQDIDLLNEDTHAWKAALDVDQDLLKVTSLWVEYGKVDREFLGGVSNAYNWSDSYNSSIYRWGIADADLLLIRADQKWNGQWGSFIRYAQSEYDVDSLSKVKNLTFGVNYQYKPQIGFQLAYDHVDYGDLATAALHHASDDTDHLIRFRTTVNF